MSDFLRSLNVLELYSGIGGMHWAMKGCTCARAFTVVAAVDINTTANEVYKHNFPETPILQRNIEVISKLVSGLKYTLDVDTCKTHADTYRHRQTDRQTDRQMP
jgi:tRNA (cytosine38-C5)-methyltransferase